MTSVAPRPPVCGRAGGELGADRWPPPHPARAILAAAGGYRGWGYHSLTHALPFREFSF